MYWFWTLSFLAVAANALLSGEDDAQQIACNYERLGISLQTRQNNTIVIRIRPEDDTFSKTCFKYYNIYLMNEGSISETKTIPQYWSSYYFTNLTCGSYHVVVEPCLSKDVISFVIHESQSIELCPENINNTEDESLPFDHFRHYYRSMVKLAPTVESVLEKFRDQKNKENDILNNKLEERVYDEETKHETNRLLAIENCSLLGALKTFQSFVQGASERNGTIPSENDANSSVSTRQYEVQARFCVSEDSYQRKLINSTLQAHLYYCYFA